MNKKGVGMKKVVSVQEVDGEGLVGLLGERITVFSLNYIYTGDLVGVNDNCIKLDNAAIVYETGPFNDSQWKDAQPLPNSVYVATRCIESFTVLK